MAIYNIVVALLFIPEVVVELAHDRRVTWKQPSLIAKITYIIIVVGTLTPSPLPVSSIFSYEMEVKIVIVHHTF